MLTLEEIRSLGKKGAKQRQDRLDAEAKKIKDVLSTKTQEICQSIRDAAYQGARIFLFPLDYEHNNDFMREANILAWKMWSEGNLGEGLTFSQNRLGAQVTWVP